MVMDRPCRRALATVGASALVAAMLTSGCASTPQVPAVAFPSAAVPRQLAVSAAPIPTFTGYNPPLGAVVTTISGVAANTTLHYPMTWLTFTVKLDNTSTYPFSYIEPLIVFGQCTCNSKHYDTAPHTQVELWDPKTSTWTLISPGTMDSSLSYKPYDQMTPINLGPKASVTFSYRMEMMATTQQNGLVSGASSLDVFVLQLPGRTRVTVGLGPDASVPILYLIN